MLTHDAPAHMNCIMMTYDRTLGRTDLGRRFSVVPAAPAKCRPGWRSPRVLLDVLPVHPPGFSRGAALVAALQAQPGARSRLRIPVVGRPWGTVLNVSST